MVRLARAPGAGALPRARRVAWRLSAVVTGLLAGASAVGLVWRGSSQDAPANVATFRGYDLGTLLLGTPLLVGAWPVPGTVHPVPTCCGRACWPTSSTPTRTTSSARRSTPCSWCTFLVHVAVFVLAAVALGTLLAGMRPTRTGSGPESIALSA